MLCSEFNYFRGIDINESFRLQPKLLLCVVAAFVESKIRVMMATVIGLSINRDSCLQTTVRFFLRFDPSNSALLLDQNEQSNLQIRSPYMFFFRILV